MGFDYEKQRFTSEPHQMLAAQVTRLVCELAPGDTGIVHNEYIWVERTPDKETWINGYADVLTDNAVIALGETDPGLYSRVFCVSEGLVVDRSHLDIRTWSWNNLLSRQSLEGEADALPLPIIYCAHNFEELELVQPALKKSGIKLKKLNTITALLKAIDEAEEIEEDSDFEEIDTPGEEE